MCRSKLRASRVPHVSRFSRRVRPRAFPLPAGGPHLGRVSPTRIAFNVGRKKTGVPHFSRFSKSGPPDGQHYSDSDSSDTKTTKVTIGNLCQSSYDGPAIHIHGKGRHAYPQRINACCPIDTPSTIKTMNRKKLCGRCVSVTRPSFARAVRLTFFITPSR
jgi:hypothetical protein